MNKLLSILASLIAGSVPAFAADMQLKAPAPPLVNSTTWAGFYIGAGVGGMFNTSINPDTPLLDTFKMSGITYGGFAGRNWQVSSVVVGLEVNFDWANRHATNTIQESVTSTATVKYLGSARARIGFTPWQNMLLYGTAGAGWANDTADITDGKTTANAATNHFGWVGGGGLEYMFATNWTARLEYLHYDLGKASYSFGPVININVPAELKVDTVKFGLAYKFGV